MAVEFVADFGGIGELMRSEQVRAALHDAAIPILVRAKALAGQAKLDEYEKSLRIEDGVRPKGRPFSRVVADYQDATAFEWGDTNKGRRRILGEAANAQVF